MPARRPPRYSAVLLYPFVRGESAMVAALTDDQWREFGSTLRDVHASAVGGRLRGRLLVETFSLPSAALVLRLMRLVHEISFGGAAARLAEFWREHAGRICWMLARAEALGSLLRTRPFEYVRYHADIHAANILVGDDGRLHLIDWGGPIIAPRERDLLCGVGSKISRAVEPREEAELFFEGYGPVEIDPEALIYYRYERIIEDLGEFGKSVFLDPSLDNRAREEKAELATSFFAPDGMVELAETVTPSSAGGRAPRRPADRAADRATGKADQPSRTPPRRRPGKRGQTASSAEHFFGSEGWPLVAHKVS